MSMTIWRFKTRRSISNIASSIGFIAFMVFLLLLVALTSPPQYRLNNTLGLAIFIIPITVLFLMLGNVFSRPFEVVFTEDGLVVRGRGGFTVPKDAVVSGGVVCIRRSPVRLELRITHGLNNYLIPLSQRQYDELVNALNTYWGWELPECPRVKPVVPETAPSVGEGVLWRWSVGKYGILYRIGWVGAVIALFFIALGLYGIIGTIAWVFNWRGFLADLTVGIIVIVIVGVLVLMTRGTLRLLFGSNAREVVLTSDGFTVTDRSGNVMFIPRDDALDSICISEAVPYGNWPYWWNIDFIMIISYGGVTYKVPMNMGDFNRLQEALSRAWGRGVRNC
jgi:hypothetical protein